MTVRPRNSGKSSFQTSHGILLSTSFDHAFQLRFRPRHASGRTFRPRLCTSHWSRRSSCSGMLGSWVGAQRRRTRGKSFSGFSPDDCEALTTAFFWDSSMNLCCICLTFCDYSNSSHLRVHSLDFENSSQRTSIANQKHRCESVLS